MQAGWGFQVNACPRCGAKPFEHFLRWQVYRSFSLGRFLRNLLRVLSFRGAVRAEEGDFAVICRNCKNIVGYE